MKNMSFMMFFVVMPSISLAYEPIGGASTGEGMFGSQSWSSPYSSEFSAPQSNDSYENINKNDAFSLKSYRSIDYWDTPALIESPSHGIQNNPSKVWLWSTPPID